MRTRRPRSTHRSTRRRAVATLVIVLAVVGVLVTKLVDVQVVQADTLDKQAAAKRGAAVTLDGPRGDIVDSSGTVLASSVKRYDVSVSPVNANKWKSSLDSGKTVTVTLEDAAAEIGAVTGQSASEILTIISDALEENPESQYASIIKDVDVPTYQKLKALDIPWLYFTSHPARAYPNGAVAGNLLGFVGYDGSPVAGLEKAYDSCLAGEDGQENYRRSVGGVPLPGSTVIHEEPKKGGTLELTLDADLQWFAQEQLATTVPSLGAQFGMVTVADAKTGDILTAAQYPSVDPNKVGATEPGYRGALMFSTPFEPGSIFKPLTAAALVDSGKATPGSKVVAPYHFNPGNGAEVYDAFYHNPLHLTLAGVLMESSNTGMSILGSKMSDKARYDYLTRFGIGRPTGITFPAQSSGILRDVDDWDVQTRYATMFGQGVSATQAQMVGAYQAIANDGVKVPLSLVKGCRQADGTVVDAPKKKGTRVISSDSASKVRRMMETVSEQGELKNVLKIPGYHIGAKTGTAQEPDGHGGYQRYYYVSVMGMVPVDNPRYVVSVNIGYPTTITSSAAAAPLFRTIMSQVIKNFRVKPTQKPADDYPPFY